LRLLSFGGYGLALAALALVVFGAIECPPNEIRETEFSAHGAKREPIPLLFTTFITLQPLWSIILQTKCKGVLNASGLQPARMTAYKMVVCYKSPVLRCHRSDRMRGPLGPHYSHECPQRRKALSTPIEAKEGARGK